MTDDRYKIIKQVEDVFISNIPLIVNKIVICKDLYTDKKIIKISIKNIGTKKINNAKLFIQFINNNGKEKERIDFVFNDIDLKNNQEEILEVNIEFKEINNNDMFKVVIYEIEIESQKESQEIVLNRVKREQSIFLQEKLGEQYKREISLISNKFINIKNQYEKFDKIWHCVCGNYSFEDINVCPECNLKREELEKITDKKYLENKLEEYEKKQAEIRDKTIKEAKRVGNKTLKIAIIVIVAVIIGIVAFLIGKDVFVKKMLKENNIEQAIRINNNVLNDYKDYIYNLIGEYDKNNDVDNEILLLSNINEYALDNEYADKYIEVQYKYIIKEYENENYENCYIYLEKVLENDKYKNDSELLEKATVIKYHKALSYIEQEEYEKAKEILINIEYSDSKSKLDITNYNIAKKKLNNKQYKEAKELFEQMNEPYEDSNELLKDAKYNYALERYEKYKTSNSYETSTLEQLRDEFSSIGEYKETIKYLSEISDALKWHGVWHNVAFGENYYYYYDIKFNYFTKTLTSHGLTGSVDEKYEKDGDRFVSNSYISTSILYKQGEILVSTSQINGGSNTELKYKR